MALTDIFEDEGVETRCMSNIFAEQVVESYSFRLAQKHLERNRVVVVAGGVARPYMTHDTAAISIALELDCEVAFKATKVDGIYDADPAVKPNAKLLAKISFQEAVENDAIKIMDKAALGLAMEQHKPIIVFNPMVPGTFLKGVQGEAVGSFIS
jgi:uridylate kinase